MVVALLRGVNIGPRNRTAMSALREALANEGLPARTYVQSGNLILDSDLPADALAARVRTLIASGAAPTDRRGIRATPGRRARALCLASRGHRALEAVGGAGRPRPGCERHRSQLDDGERAAGAV
jgi:hypothetical protein